MSDKYKENRVIPQFLHILMITILFLPFMAGMTSCGSDDKDDEPTVDPAEALYGTWSTEKDDFSEYPWRTYLMFNPDGILSAKIEIPPSLDQGGGFGMGTITTEYRYEVLRNTLLLYGSKKEDYSSVLSYKIIGNQLELEHISGSNPLFVSISDNNGGELKFENRKALFIYK